MRDTIYRIIDDILDALEKRNGFDHFWYSVDKDTREEIEDELRKIVEKHLEKPLDLE